MVDSTVHDSAAAGDSVNRWGLLAAVVAGTCLLWLPTPEGLTPPAQRLVAVTVMMAVLWFGQFVPVALTSLLPIILYPLLGIVDAGTACAPYANKNVFLFLGGFLIALGLEKSGLHRRLALHLVSRVGSGPHAIVFGFMCTTALLSMWISNTAATMLMVPIALALLSTLRETGERGEFDVLIKELTAPTLLGIAYGASTGGFATLIGTPTNVTFRGYWDEEFVSQGAETISAAAWMLTFTPVSVLLLILIGILLTWPLPRKTRLAALGRAFFRARIAALGLMRRSERIVAVVFFLTALLWMTRVPIVFDSVQLVPGWTTTLAHWGQHLGLDLAFLSKYVDDANIAMGMGALLFILPGDVVAGHSGRPLVTWSEAQTAIPWGMLLLIGSGFAIADAFGETGLSTWLGGWIAHLLQGQSPLLLVVGICLFVTFLTEFTTNVATLNMLLPVLAGVAVDLNIPPLLILLPATISASCAYMLPVGTPPNAIVFSTGKVSMVQMARTGFVINLLGVAIVTLAMQYWAPLTMNMQTVAPVTEQTPTAEPTPTAENTPGQGT